MAERPKEFFEIYPQDTIEVAIIIIIIQAILDKPINFEQVIRASLVIAALIFIAQSISNDFKQNMRQGFHYSIGSFIMLQFTGVIS